MLYMRLIKPAIVRLFAVSLFISLWIVSSGHATPSDDISAKFCVLPVDLDHQTVDLSSAWVIPNFPSPLFIPRFGARPGHLRYSIDENRRLVEYHGIYPQDSINSSGHWVEEPWSSRVVTVNGSHPAITVISPGDKNFHTIFDTPFIEYNQYQWLSGPMVITKTRQTLILKPGGHPYVVGANGISPWLTEAELFQHGMQGITNVYYAQSISATVIIDVDGHIHLITDDGVWEDLGKFDPYHFSIGMGFDRFAEFYDLPALRTVILAFVQGGRELRYTIIAVHKNLPGNQNRYSIQRFEPSGWFHHDGTYAFSTTFSQLLRFGGGSYFSPYSYIPHWQIFTGRGFKDIPGGRTNAVVPQGDVAGFRQTLLKPLTSIDRDLIQGDSKFFLYNGTSILPVSDATTDKLGAFPEVYDLPSIGHVLVGSDAGLFDLRPDGRLIQLKMPFSVSAPYGVTLADWKEAGIALAETSDGLYAINKDLTATLIPGGQQFKNTWLIQMNLGDILPFKEKVVANLHALYAVIDTNLSGPNSCKIN